MAESSGEFSEDPGEITEDVLARVFRNSRYNAMLSWLLIGILGIVLIESVVDGDNLWMIFASTTGIIVLVPPVIYRHPRVMLPWELLVVALLPILVRGFAAGDIGTFSYYLAIAGLALIIIVELHMFTELRLTHWFAVTLVVLTTMASIAGWTIIRWNLDQQVGTTFLIDPEMSQEAANNALMVEFLWVTLAGIAAGVLFDTYFRRRGRRLRRRLRRVING